MSKTDHLDEDRLRRAAESTILVFVSRWSTVLLVPIILGVGGWIVSSVQTLNVTVSNLQAQINSQAKLYDEKIYSTDRTLQLRMTAVERRVDRIEFQQDRKTVSPLR